MKRIRMKDRRRQGGFEICRCLGASSGCSGGFETCSGGFEIRRFLGAALLFLSLLALTACQPEDDADSSQGTITITRIEAGIEGMGTATTTRVFTENETTGYTGAEKTSFVAKDVIHLIVADKDNDAPKCYSCAKLNDQGTWDISPAITLKGGDEKIIAFYNNVKDPYEDADKALGGAYEESNDASPGDVLIADGGNGQEGSGGSVTISNGVLTLSFVHQHALICVSSIDNHLGTGYDVIGISAHITSSSQGSCDIPLITDGSGGWQCIANGYYETCSFYNLKSFTVTLGTGTTAAGSLTVNVSSYINGGFFTDHRDLYSNDRYTYHLTLLPGSATAILQDEDQGPAWTDARRDPTVPAGYIPIYTVRDLEKIGAQDGSGNPKAEVNGYTYTTTDDSNGTDLTFRNDAKYILMADIDLAATPAAGTPAKSGTADGANWTPIGGAGNFSGYFNGNGHTIKGMRVAVSDDNAGFFDNLYGATIYNLHIEGATVTGTNTNGKWICVGALAGNVYHSSIALCSATDCRVTSTGDAGGLIGNNIDSYLTRCHATNCAVTSFKIAGGLTGSNDNGSILAACYSTNCNASSSDANSYTHTGGLSGYNNGTTFYGCYVTGAKVTAANSGDHIGALAGYLNSGNGNGYFACTVVSCYALTGDGSTLGGDGGGSFEASKLIGEIHKSSTPISTVLACISPLEEDGSSSGGSSEPTGYGITYCGAGYSPLTSSDALTASGSPGYAILPTDVSTVISTDGALDVKKRKWAVAGIWGTLPTDDAGSKIPPHILWSYDGGD